MKGDRVPGLPTDEEIDRLVVAQADDDSAWGPPVRVRPAKPTAVALPAELAARAAFFARLHRAASLQEWLRRVVEERVDLEEAAFDSVKRELAASRTA